MVLAIFAEVLEDISLITGGKSSFEVEGLDDFKAAINALMVALED